MPCRRPSRIAASLHAIHPASRSHGLPVSRYGTWPPAMPARSGLGAIGVSAAQRAHPSTTCPPTSSRTSRGGYRRRSRDKSSTQAPSGSISKAGPGTDRADRSGKAATSHSLQRMRRLSVWLPGGRLTLRASLRQRLSHSATSGEPRGSNIRLIWAGRVATAFGWRPAYIWTICVCPHSRTG